MSKAIQTFEKAASKASRILKPLLNKTHGFAGHRTNDITKVIKEGLKPASEVVNNAGISAKEVNLTKSRLEFFADQLGSFIKDVKADPTGTKRINEAAKIKSIPGFNSAEELGKFKGKSSDFHLKLLNTNKVRSKKIEAEIKSLKPIENKYDLDTPYVSEYDWGGAAAPAGKFFKDLKKTKTPEAFKKHLADSPEYLYVAKPRGDVTNKARELAVKMYNTKFVKDTPEARKAVKLHHEHLRYNRPSVYDPKVSKALKERGLDSTDYSDIIKDKDKFKSQTLKEFKENILGLQKNFENKTLRKVFKNQEPKVIQETIKKDPKFLKEVGSELGTGDYTNPAGAPHVFFMKDTIFKPSKRGEGVGDYGVIMSTKKIRAKSSSFTETEKNFAGHGLKIDRDIKPRKPVGQELSGRPSSKNVAYKVTGKNTAIIVPKKDWAKFSKDNPTLAKVREDKAQKIMRNLQQPMVSTSWANKVRKSS